MVSCEELNFSFGCNLYYFDSNRNRDNLFIMLMLLSFIFGDKVKNFVLSKKFISSLKLEEKPRKRT